MKPTKTMTLSQFKTKHIGKKNSSARKKLEQDSVQFYLGAMIAEARRAKGLTQQELADLTGITKSYISRLENNIKEARISTLQRIVEQGLGGTLELSVKF